MGWLYWALWSLVTSVDVIVASNVLYFWDTFNTSAHYLELNLYYNFTIIKHFFCKIIGETEFWLSLIKVLTIIVFVIFGFLMIFGIFRWSCIWI
ncbi:hypothetical protein ACVXZY_07510 [Staphylococcus aureus]